MQGCATDMRDQVSYGTKGQGKTLAGKENARGMIEEEAGGRSVINALLF